MREPHDAYYDQSVAEEQAEYEARERAAYDADQLARYEETIMTTDDRSHLDGAQRIAEERARQQAMGWSVEHDREHDNYELTRAAECYVRAARGEWSHAPEWKDGHPNMRPEGWPFEVDAWHPSDDPARNLEKAGALIAAEIDRVAVPETERELRDLLRVLNHEIQQTITHPPDPEGRARAMISQETCSRLRQAVR